MRARWVFARAFQGGFRKRLTLQELLFRKVRLEIAALCFYLPAQAGACICNPNRLVPDFFERSDIRYDETRFAAP
jgi:hypothetical protein